MQEQLDRIEGMLVELLKRKRAPAQKRQSKAQVHDDAVALSKQHFPMKGPQDEWNAWLLFCSSRAESGKYLTQNAVDALMGKLAKFSVAERIRALNDSVASGWSGVFPKAQEGGAVMGQDYFNREQA